MLCARCFRFATFPRRDDVQIVFHPEGASAQHCESVLRSLPEWFGIEESLLEYAANAGVLPTWVASRGEETLGFLSLRRHFGASAEIDAIAVRKGFRGRGLGKRLVAAAASSLAGEGIRMLQVKTLGPSDPCAEYAETRRFYERCGFVALEEFHRLWDGHPCLVMVKSLVSR